MFQFTLVCQSLTVESNEEVKKSCDSEIKLSLSLILSLLESDNCEQKQLTEVIGPK